MPGYINFQKIEEQAQLLVPSETAAKRVKVATSEDIDSKSAAKAGNARTLRSEKDIKNSENNPLSSPQQDNSAKAKNGSDHFNVWLGDAMTLFMFDNAPLLMRLSFELREMLSKSQTVEAQAQMAAAQASAQAKKDEGVSDAKKCMLSAQAEIGSAVSGALQGGMGLKDELLHSNAYENELANHDAIHADLNAGKAVHSNAALEGSTVEEMRSEEGLTEEEKVQFRALTSDQAKAEFKTNLNNDKIAKLAKDYHAAYHNAFNEELSDIQSNKFENMRANAASNSLGLGKSPDIISDEQKLIASERAGKTAFEKVLKEADPALSALIEKIKSDPKSADIFMKNLGSSSDEILGAIRGMDRNFRTQMLRSHGQAEGSSSFKADVARIRGLASDKAGNAKSILDRGTQKRQLLFSILTSSTSAGTGILSADQLIKSAVKEAISKGEDTISAVMQAARGAQDGTIQGALAQVQALLDWYSQMESQVIGAVSQSMA